MDRLGRRSPVLKGGAGGRVYRVRVSLVAVVKVKHIPSIGSIKLV